MLGKLFEEHRQAFIRHDLVERLRLLDCMLDAELDEQLDLMAIDPVVISDVHVEQRNQISHQVQLL